MDTQDCSDYISPGFRPNSDGMTCAALLGDDKGQPVSSVAGQTAALTGWREPVKPTGKSCRISLRVAFFFDGTGNNRDADEPSLKNSNVARLYRAHHRDDEANGIYHFYVPGVATYFPEIGDPGGGRTELAMGQGGQGRLDWALKQLKQVVAKHPPANIVELRISAFGFSRGAAEARAFANMVQEQCQGNGSNWRWKQGGIPVHFYFLGLFDTVASVGLVHTASLVDSAYVASGWMRLDNALKGRRYGADGDATGLEGMAFGAAPGADPAANSAGNGHADWGSKMAIPAMVEKCIHFVAAHEQRNSFPCESVRVGNAYPSGCEEYVYPGMHSDVGGGYQPGEQGRSVHNPQKLSQLPLLHMHAQAVASGVPLYSINELPAQEYKSYFQLAPILQERWKHYMDTAGRGNKSLGQMVLAHTRLWYQWRFHRIHTYLKAINGGPGDTLPNQDAIRQQETQFANQKAAAKAQLGAAKNDPGWTAAKQQLDLARQQLSTAEQMRALGWPNDANQRRASYNQAKAQADAYQEKYDRARAKLDAVPGGGAAQGIREYDKNLMLDMKRLKELVQQKGTQKLRPHYRMLLETYDAEFSGRGLDDKDIIAFFDDYVHDSLAGFAKDVTLPSDPRCFYDGGNDLVMYASLDVPVGDQNTQIARNDTAATQSAA